MFFWAPLGAIFANIFRGFVKVFSNFAQIFRDFARVFTKSKLLVVRFHVHPLPSPPTPVVQHKIGVL